MTYIGRAGGMGETLSGGKPFALYAIAGRSDSSRMREFNVLEQTVDFSYIPIIGQDFTANYETKQRTQVVLKVDPMAGKVTDDQKVQADLIFYNAIIAQNTNARTQKPYLVVSNGTQSNIILLTHNLSPWQASSNGNQLERILHAAEVEPDAPNFTARIAGEYTFHARLGEDKKPVYDREVFTMGIVTNKPQLMSANFGIQESRGIAQIISTYVGEENKVLIPPVAKNENIHAITTKLPVKGESAEELCKEFFDFMDKEFLVSAAAAVLEEDGWKFAVIDYQKTQNSEFKKTD
ncbi:MAG: IMP cyclohydrolase [Nanoarchaeota archaeon]|nr:IMP cyclohydrolase [Nanoarchaeota archaeon]